MSNDPLTPTDDDGPIREDERYAEEIEYEMHLNGGPEHVIPGARWVRDAPHSGSDNTPSFSLAIPVDYQGDYGSPELPMPGETFDGKIVIASCWQTDDYDGGENSDLMLAVLLLLDPMYPTVSTGDPVYGTGFYSVVQLASCRNDGEEWGEIIDLPADDDIRNIVFATDHYRDMSGCV